jgi:hypothetical protein
VPLALAPGQSGSINTTRFMLMTSLGFQLPFVHIIHFAKRCSYLSSKGVTMSQGEQPPRRRY